METVFVIKECLVDVKCDSLFSFLFLPFYFWLFAPPVDASSYTTCVVLLIAMLGSVAVALCLKSSFASVSCDFIFVNLLVLTLAHPLWKQFWKLSFVVWKRCSCLLLNKRLRVSCDVNIIAGQRRRFWTGSVKHLLTQSNLSVQWNSRVGTWSEVAVAGSLYLLCIQGWRPSCCLLAQKLWKEINPSACLQKRCCFLLAFYFGLVSRWSSLCVTFCALGVKNTAIFTVLSLYYFSCDRSGHKPWLCVEMSNSVAPLTLMWESNLRSKVFEARRESNIRY